MRFLLVLFMLIEMSFICWAQTGNTTETSAGTNTPTPKAQLFFKESTHDFGTIRQGDKVQYTFEYINNGQAPLILSKVQTTCGCTASEWSRTPLAPGKTGKLKVTFDSKGKVGRQNKVISILSNAGNPEERVRLVANVMPSAMYPADSAK